MSSEHIDTQPCERPYACRAYGLAAHCVLSAGHHGDHITNSGQHFHIRPERR